MKYTAIILMLCAMILTGCSIATKSTATDPANSCNPFACSADDGLKAKAGVEKVEVIHFHATQQCYSCRTVGQFAEDTVNTYFANELKGGRITFSSINIDLVGNAELVSKYGPTGSSLWIGVYDGNGFHPEQNTNVWYKINDKQGYMLYLKGLIDRRFAGDFS